MIAINLLIGWIWPIECFFIPAKLDSSIVCLDWMHVHSRDYNERFRHVLFEEHTNPGLFFSTPVAKLMNKLYTVMLKLLLASIALLDCIWNLFRKFSLVRSDSCLKIKFWHLYSEVYLFWTKSWVWNLSFCSHRFRESIRIGSAVLD